MRGAIASHSPYGGQISTRAFFMPADCEQIVKIKAIKPHKLMDPDLRLNLAQTQVLVDAVSIGDNRANTLLAKQLHEVVAFFYYLDVEGNQDGDEELLGVPRDDLVGKIASWSKKQRKQVVAACALYWSGKGLTLLDVGLADQ
jgi:hypothetical protein